MSRTEQFQSTPPARGATMLIAAFQMVADISIHAPREGGDGTPYIIHATVEISIHAPREGGDQTMGKPRVLTSYFNPRPPRGGRHLPPFLAGFLDGFQSTPPARGATWNWVLSAGPSKSFQSTPPARGATEAM